MYVCMYVCMYLCMYMYARNAQDAMTKVLMMMNV